MQHALCKIMGIRKIFSIRGPVRDFPKIFSREGVKVVKFVFYPSKLKKQPFFANNNFNPWGAYVHSGA